MSAYGFAPIDWQQIERERQVDMSLQRVMAAKAQILNWAEELGGDRFSFAHAIDQYGIALAEHAREVMQSNPGSGLEYVLKRVYPGQSDA